MPLSNWKKNTSLPLPTMTNWSKIFSFNMLILKMSAWKKPYKTFSNPHRLDFEIISDRYIVLKEMSSLPDISLAPEPPPTLPSVCGTVIDPFEGTGLGFASISIAGSDKGVYADEKGFFRFHGIFADQDSLRNYLCWL